MKATPDELIAHEAFVRSVARGILGDVDEVDDVVQETWIRAIDSPPKRGGSFLGWLATVSRSLSLRSVRSRVRRRRRERAVPGSTTSPSTEHVVACEEIRRRLVVAMLSLDDEVRDTIVLRYYDGLPPRRIARRMGLPVETVKTRLKRGIARLRRRLEAEHGADGRQWLGSLMILALPRPGARIDGMSKLARATGLLAGGLLVLGTLLSGPLPPPGPPTGTAADHPEAGVPRVCRIEPENVADRAPRRRTARDDRPSIDETPLRGLPFDREIEPCRFPSRPLEAAAERSSFAPSPTSVPEDVVRIFLTTRGDVEDRRRFGFVDLILRGDGHTAPEWRIEAPGCDEVHARAAVVLPDGRIRVRVRLPHGAWEVASCDPDVVVLPPLIEVGDGPPLTVELDVTRISARFRLWPEEVGRPVADLAGGTLRLCRPGTRRSRTDAVADQNGEVTVAGLAPGEYDVFFIWAGSRPGDRRPLGTIVISPEVPSFLFTVPSEAR